MSADSKELIEAIKLNTESNLKLAQSSDGLANSLNDLIVYFESVDLGLETDLESELLASYAFDPPKKDH